MSIAEKLFACLILLLAAIGLITVSAVLRVATDPCASVEFKHNFLPLSWSKVPAPHCARQEGQA